MTSPFDDYLRDPDAIYQRSIQMVAAATDLSAIPQPLRSTVRRLVHSCGMPDIVPDLAWAGDPVSAGREALAQGGSVLADCRMVAVGIGPHLELEQRVRCTLNEPEVPALAKAIGNTRSAAAVELWQPYLEGSVVALGNAPTALFRLLELLDRGAPKPAAILAFPVGFVGAEESKEALMRAAIGVPYLTLRGRRGGSALAAAAVNAIGRKVFS